MLVATRTTEDENGAAVVGNRSSLKISLSPIVNLSWDRQATRIVATERLGARRATSWPQWSPPSRQLGIVNLTLAAQQSLLQMGGIYHMQMIFSPEVG